jgi:L-arabinonolactonase
MSSKDVSTALICKNILGESCFWDPRINSLIWTDIEGKKIWKLNEKNQSLDYNLPDRAGFILPRKKDGFIIGFPKHIAISNQDFSSFEKICDVEINIKQTRINDAKVDPYGGIVFGTYNEDPDKINRKPIANLYRLAPDLSLTHLLSNITVSNGIAFSQNENIMYFADTPTGRIQKFKYSQDFNKFNELDSNIIFKDVGEPDGATVDINNNYWSARVRGKCIISIDTKSEKILEKINLPTNTPTCVTFGGNNLSSLYVTSLRADPTNDNEGGNLHRIETDTRGFEQLLADI